MRPHATTTNLLRCPSGAAHCRKSSVSTTSKRAPTQRAARLARRDLRSPNLVEALVSLGRPRDVPAAARTRCPQVREGLRASTSAGTKDHLPCSARRSFQATTLPGQPGRLGAVQEPHPLGPAPTVRTIRLVAKNRPYAAESAQATSFAVATTTLRVPRREATGELARDALRRDVGDDVPIEVPAATRLCGLCPEWQAGECEHNNQGKAAPDPTRAVGSWCFPNLHRQRPSPNHRPRS